MTAKILVVDDEPLLEYVITQHFRHRIRSKELEFEFASNAAIALKKLLTSNQIDLVLTDIRMPEMDGLTLLTKLPEIDATLKAVVLSAYGDITNIRTAMNRGALDFLTKPIDFQDLEITLDKTLKFVRQLRDNQQQLQRATEKLQYQAFYDSLTGLPNSNLLLERMQQRIDEGHLFAIVFLDIERYRIVKYSLGRAAGEQLLIEVSHRLQTCLPLKATIARVETDEFALLLDEICDFQTALEVAEKIRQALCVPFNLNGAVVSSNTSIGIVNSTCGYEQPEDYLRAADIAMHAAKVQGSGGAAVFDSEMQQRAIARLQLEADLQQAIFNQKLHLNYQPIVSLVDGRLVGFEALVRWQDSKRGLVSPAEFIPLAEKTGAIVALGEWVLQEAIRCLSSWRDKFPDRWPLFISVNLSSIQLLTSNLLPFLDELLRSYSVSGEFLKLEITESILLENTDIVTAKLWQLKEKKIHLCVDDFGTGYSSLSYLHRFPIDTLKIDRSFIHSMAASSKNLALVKTIVNLARSLGAEAIAEGIETPQQLSELLSLGCEYGQGYFFSKPLAPEAAIAHLARGSL